MTCLLPCLTPNTCPQPAFLLFTSKPPQGAPVTGWRVKFATPPYNPLHHPALHGLAVVIVVFVVLVLVALPLILAPFLYPLALICHPNGGLSLVPAIDIHVIHGWWPMRGPSFGLQPQTIYGHRWHNRSRSRSRRQRCRQRRWRWCRYHCWTGI